MSDAEEWTCDGADGPCHRRAVWRTRFSYVDEHLCEAHKAEDDEPERDQFLAATGLQEGSYAVGIRGSEGCDGPILGPSCGAPATWARVVFAQSFTCDAHRSTRKQVVP